MRPPGVEVAPPALGDYLSLFNQVESLVVEQLVTQPGVLCLKILNLACTYIGESLNASAHLLAGRTDDGLVAVRRMPFSPSDLNAAISPGR